METLTPEQKKEINDNILIIQGWIHNPSLIPFEDLMRNTHPIFASLIKSITAFQKPDSPLNPSQSHGGGYNSDLPRNHGITSSYSNFNNNDTDKVAQLRSQIEKLKLENANLKKSNDTLKNMNDRSKLNPAQPQSPSTSSGSQNPFSSQSNELQNQIDSLLKEKATIQKQLDIERQENMSLQNKIELAKLTCDNLSCQIDVMKQEKAELKLQVEDWKQDSEFFQMKVEEAKNDFEHIQSQYNQLQKEKNSLSSQLNESKNLNNTTQGKLTALLSQFSISEQTVANLNRQISEIQNQKEQSDQRLMNKTQENVELTKKINELTANLSKNQQDSMKNSEKAKEDNDKLKTTLNDLKNSKDKLLAQISALQTENSSLKELNIINSEKLSTLTMTLNQTQANDKTKELIESLNNKNKEVDSLKLQTKQNENELHSKIKENNELKDQISQNQETINILNTRIKEQSDQIESQALTINDQAEQITQKMESLKNLEVLKNANQSLDTTQQELVALIDSLKAELASNIEQVKTLQKTNTENLDKLKKSQTSESSLKEKQNQLIRISKALQITNNELNKQIAEKDERINKLTDENKLLNNQTNPSNNINQSNLKNQTSLLSMDENEIKAIIQRDEELLKEIENLKKNTTNDSKLQAQLTKCTEQITKLKNEKNNLRNKLMSIVAMCKYLQKAKNDLTTDKNNLSTEVKEATSNLQAAKSKAEQLQKEINELKESNSKLTTTNKNLKQMNLGVLKIQNEFERLRQENQKLNEQVLEFSKAPKSPKNAEQTLEISKLQTELKKKKTEIEDLKKTNKKAISKLEKENESLKAKQIELTDQINYLESKRSDDSLSDSSELRPPNMADLRRQNDMLKRRIELISQNFELEKIEIQTSLEQKENQMKQLQAEIDLHKSSPARSNNSEIERLRVENNQLKDKLSRLASAKGGSAKFYQMNNSISIDEFRSRSTKFQFAISRLFSQVSSRLLAMNSKVSFLQYRLKLKKGKKDVKVPHKLLNVLQVLGIQRSRSKHSLDQACEDIYRAVYRMKEKQFNNDNICDTLGSLVGMEGFDESEILAAVQKRLKNQTHLEVKYNSTKNTLKSIRRLLQKERNNDVFAEAVRQLFVNQ